MKISRLFCLIELAAVAALYFFENNSGTRAALAVSALVPLLSVLCAYRCSRKAALSLDVPRHGEKGASLVCRLCAPPLLLCEGRAELRLQNAFTREEARAAAVVGEAVSLSVPHCGLLTVTAENAEIRDLFGLCRFPVSSGAPQTVPVWPTVFPAQVTLDCAAPQTREDSRLSSVRRGGDFTETQAVRPYHPGDPVRQIHWKLSAKAGRYMVRDAAKPVDHRLTIYVERRTAPPRLADGLMEAAVSLCQAYVDQPFRLMWSGETTSVREITGEEQLPEAVTALLKSKAQEEPQPPELRPEGKLLYCCTQLPADGQLPEDAVVLLCSDEPCAGEGVCRFTPEDMQEILGKWMWN